MLGLLSAALLGALAALGGLFWLQRFLHEPHAGWQGQAVDVELPAGLDAGAMLERLAAAGVVRNPRVLRAWLAARGGAERLHAGEYRFERPASPLEVLRRLRAGDVLLHPLTIPEGLTLAEVARRLAEEGWGSPREVAASFDEGRLVQDLDPLAPDLEGYLFPDTYFFPRGVRPESITEAMVRRFREVTGEGYAAQAAAVGLSLRQAVILASLIEKETGIGDERRRIAQVFHNRLHRAMRLECDPSVLYALRRAGRPVTQLTREQLSYDSPWNTYRVVGLPPGPIANPGRESLIAVVTPLGGDELYFVASPDGGHRFSRSLSEHARAVAAWRSYVRSSR